MKKQILFTVVPLYSIGFLFNLVFSLTAIMIPLFGVSMGYSATEIGILLSIPGVLQVFLRMFAGMLSDRYGEKNVLALTHGLTIASGLIFTFNLSFVTLAIFQIFMGTCRSIFWPTSQSYASRIAAGKSSAILGRFHSFNEGGKMSGMLFGGWAITKIGYLAAFRLIAGFGLIGLIIVLFLKSIPREAEERSTITNSGMSFKDLIKTPPLQFGLIIAFSAGLLAALSQSFLPVWLKGLGNSEALISVIVATYLVGSVSAGRLFAMMLRKMRLPSLLQLSLGAVGIGFLLISIVKGLISVFVLTLLLGFFAGFLTISYQLMAANNSTESNRGLILSFVGLGWGTAFLIGPTLFGLLVDGLTVTVAFGCLGLLLLLYSVFLKTLHGYFTGPAKESRGIPS